MVSVLENGKSEITLLTLGAEPAGMPVFVTIKDGKGKSEDYWVDHLDSDFGTAMKFRKIGGEENYDVLLGGENYSCECKGFLRHGHCKHGQAARQLLQSGEAPRPAPRPEQAVEMPAKAERVYGPPACGCSDYRSCKCEV